jgi:hypothetical protein
MQARNQRAMQILAEPNRHKLVVIIAACQPRRVFMTARGGERRPRRQKQ